MSLDINQVSLYDRGRIVTGGGSGGGEDTTVRYNEETDWIQVLYNNVWTNWKKAYMNIDPTKMDLTQEEFIRICNAGLQSQMTIGAIITLNNSYCNTYEVIDVNHDSTLNSVDIMAHTQVYSMNANTQNYNQSTLRTWVNDTYRLAFDYDIRQLMKTMEVTTIGVTQNDKVKLLSWRELGVTQSSEFDSSDGGTRYPVFTAGAKGTEILDRWRTPGLYGHAERINTRSRYSTNWRTQVVNNGIVSFSNNEAGILPVMRF